MEPQKNPVITIGEYFESQKNRERKPFYEPVNEYKILINKGQIAFVWADATLHSYGVPRTNNIDNFKLMKEDGEWKFISISFTNTPLPEELKTLDLEIFAKSYAQVWCNQRPDFVASFFAEDGEAGGTPELIKYGVFTLNGTEYKVSESNFNHAWTFSPAVSLFVESNSESEIKDLFEKLSSNGGQVMIPLDSYDEGGYGFGKKFRWCADKYGVNWQLILSD